MSIDSQSSFAARALGLAVLLGAGIGHAEPAPARPEATRSARLSYTRGRGAEQCPDQEAVQSAVTERLGYDPFQPDAPRTVTATLRRSNRALHGDVELRDADGIVTGTRHLTTAENDCSELVAALALAISIAIDPGSLLRPTPPPAPPSPAPAPPLPAPVSPEKEAIAPAPPAEIPPPAPPPKPASSPPAAIRPTEPRSPITWRFGLGSLLSTGTAPGLSGGFTAQAGLRWWALSAAVEGRADLPASKFAEGGGAVRASLLTVSLVPCFHAGLVIACALGSIGSLRGSGSGVPNPKNDATLFATAGLRLGAEIPLVGPLALRFHGDLAATLTRTALQLEDRPVWTTPPVSAALGAGLLVHFP